jgi:hypothetical protein
MATAFVLVIGFWLLSRPYKPRPRSRYDYKAGIHY